MKFVSAVPTYWWSPDYIRGMLKLNLFRRRLPCWTQNVQFVQISVVKISSFWVQSWFSGLTWVLFPHPPRVRIWMLRVTMLIRMIYWIGFQMAKTICQSVAWFKRYKTLKSVPVGSGRVGSGRVGRWGRSSWENYHIKRKLARPSASLVNSYFHCVAGERTPS